jgi:hypothetical protein
MWVTFRDRDGVVWVRGLVFVERVCVVWIAFREPCCYKHLFKYKHNYSHAGSRFHSILHNHIPSPLPYRTVTCGIRVFNGRNM